MQSENTILLASQQQSIMQHFVGYYEILMFLHKSCHEEAIFYKCQNEVDITLCKHVCNVVLFIYIYFLSSVAKVKLMVKIFDV